MPWTHLERQEIMNKVEPINFSLEGKVVFVTEAQPDDGGDLPMYLAQAGADLALVAPNPDDLVATAEAVRALGRDCKTYGLDFTDLASITSAVEQCVRDFGRIDVLVNNVGYNVPALGLETKPEDWNRILQVNLTGPFFCAQAAGQHMVKAGRGRVINVGTHSGIKANFRRSAYGSARAGMAQFTRILALEWASSGVTVNSVAPSFIKAYNLETYPEMYEGMRLKNPMQRFASEAEVAAAIIFLASDAARYITGQILAVDGGSSL